MKPSIIPNNLRGKELFDFVVKNEELIIHAKKAEMKKADGVFSSNFFVDEKGTLISKSFSDFTPIPDTSSKLKLTVVINTTNYFDSHWDVHIPGLWNKSLADNRKKGFYLLKKHGRDFEDVIGEGLSGSAKKISWKDLGFDYAGITEALLFSGEIEKGRNEYMFNQYAKGYVKQHSVGMRYKKLITCINDDDYPVQKENWDKYFPEIVNKEEAEENGIFWAVLDAMILEGSAVLFGSNDTTPTYLVEDISTNNEPPVGTQDEPHKDDSVGDSFLKYINETKFINL